MKCVVCKNGDTHPGETTVTFERDEATIVVKAVPAEVCESCGESYISDKISEQLLKQVEGTAKSGVQVDVRRFVAA